MAPVSAMDESEQAQLLAAALQQSGIGIGELWLRYFSIVGSAGETEIEAYVHLALALPVLERDVLAQAANELIAEIPPPPQAPFSQELTTPELPAPGQHWSGTDGTDGTDDSDGPAGRPVDR